MDEKTRELFGDDYLEILIGALEMYVKKDRKLKDDKAAIPIMKAYRMIAGFERAKRK